jgi:hypothetical protein
MSMKNPPTLTPAAIEPATFRFVAQHLNNCATAFPCDMFYFMLVGAFHGFYKHGNTKLILYS